MGQLHEVLAVEPDLKNAAQSAFARARHEFSAAEAQLVGMVRTYTPIREGEEQLPAEEKALPTTVDDEVANVVETWSRWIDAAVQKEITNQEAAADLEVDGDVLLENMPATALLNLEGKLTQLRRMFEEVPVTDLARRWTWDEHRGRWVSEPEQKLRTKKVPRSHVLYEATPEHPAQVEMYHEDEVVGRWETVYESGKWSPARKKQVLERVDALIRATRKARQRANQQEVVAREVAQKLFDHIMGSG